jgi:hypothetical protein
VAVGLVQVRAQTTVAATTATAALLAGAGAGNLLVVLAGAASLQTAPAVTGGWTKDHGGVASQRLHVWSFVATGGETSFQFNTSVSQSQPTYIYEFSGITSGVLDQLATGSGTSVTSMSTGTTATTTAADEAAVTCIACGSSMSGASAVWTNSFTDAGQPAAGTRGSYKLLTATGTQETTFGPWTTARTGNSVILTYKAGAAAAASLVPPRRSMQHLLVR